MQIRHDHLYSWAKPECLDYLDDGEDEQYENLSIHETHGGRCPGDLATSARVDSFRIDRVTRQIEWLSFDGNYQPYSRPKQVRNNR